MKLTTLILTLAMTLVLSACGSINTVIKNQENNQTSGVVYGMHATDLSYEGAVKFVCDKTKNKDPRCANQASFQGVAVITAFGYADGAVAVIALAPKDMNIGEACATGSEKCSYLKVQVEPGKLGTVEGIASMPGDGKCHWSGMPRIGGVVCPAYNWDYRKDNDAANSSHF